MGEKEKRYRVDEIERQNERIAQLKEEERRSLDDLKTVLVSFNKILNFKKAEKEILDNEILEGTERRLIVFDKLRQTRDNLENLESTSKKIRQLLANLKKRHGLYNIKYNQVLKGFLPSYSQQEESSISLGNNYIDNGDNELTIKEIETAVSTVDMDRNEEATSTELFEKRERYIEQLNKTFNSLDTELNYIEKEIERLNSLTSDVEKKKRALKKTELTLKKEYNELTDLLKRKKREIKKAIEEDNLIIDEYLQLINRLKAVVDIPLSIKNELINVTATADEKLNLLYNIDNKQGDTDKLEERQIIIEEQGQIESGAKEVVAEDNPPSETEIDKTMLKDEAPAEEMVTKEDIGLENKIEEDLGALTRTG